MSGDHGTAPRPDMAHVGLFNRFEDAVAEASFRAAVSRWKHRVHFEPNNRWWTVTTGSRMPE